jgi:hypothetical protein
MIHPNFGQVHGYMDMGPLHHMIHQTFGEVHGYVSKFWTANDKPHDSCPSLRHDALHPIHMFDNCLRCSNIHVYTTNNIQDW